MAKKERLPYIDVAKGLLILMVVWGHYELMLRLCFKINDPVIDRLDEVENLWVSFFMPAFFFITGYCSSFNKPFKQFAWNTFRIILMPALIICYTIFSVKHLYWDYGIVWVIKSMVKNIILNGTTEWFLTTLFLSRLIVWGVLKIKNSGIELIIMVASLFLGVGLYDYGQSLTEIWSYKHTLMMLIFLWSGAKAKNLKLIPPPRKELSWIYAVLITVLLLLHVSIPYITNRVDVPFAMTPVVLILAMTGILFILQVSKWINSNSVLQYLGRNSLIIYLVHFSFYELYMSYLTKFYNQSVLISVALFFGVIIANVISCCIIARLLNTKYLKWVIGK